MDDILNSEQFQTKVISIIQEYIKNNQPKEFQTQMNDWARRVSVTPLSSVKDSINKFETRQPKVIKEAPVEDFKEYLDRQIDEKCSEIEESLTLQIEDLKSEYEKVLTEQLSQMEMIDGLLNKQKQHFEERIRQSLQLQDHELQQIKTIMPVIHEVSDLHEVMVKLQKCFEVFTVEQNEFVASIENYNEKQRERDQQTQEQIEQMHERLTLVWQGLDFLSTEYWKMRPNEKPPQVQMPQQPTKKKFIIF